MESLCINDLVVPQNSIQETHLISVSLAMIEFHHINVMICLQTEY